MNFYPSTYLLPIGWPLKACFVGLTVLVFAAGCQKGEPQDSSVVSPPDPSPGSEASDRSNGAPGTLVLPADADLNQQPAPSTDAPQGSGGLEMPQDANLDETSATGSGSGPSSDVRYATWQQIEQGVKSSGKVTVVDLWSLVCEPCLKEFPGLVRLHQEYGDRVQCIAVDVDFDGRKTRPPETYEERVTAFIDSVGATFPTYISQTPSDDVYAANKLASIPAVLVYDSDGELVQIFEDAGDTVGFTYEKDVAPLVKKLAG